MPCPGGEGDEGGGKGEVFYGVVEGRGEVLGDEAYAERGWVCHDIRDEDFWLCGSNGIN